jgi:hypothetical protein
MLISVKQLKDLYKKAINKPTTENIKEKDKLIKESPESLKRASILQDIIKSLVMEQGREAVMLGYGDSETWPSIVKEPDVVDYEFFDYYVDQLECNLPDELRVFDGVTIDGYNGDITVTSVNGEVDEDGNIIPVSVDEVMNCIQRSGMVDTLFDKGMELELQHKKDLQVGL